MDTAERHEKQALEMRYLKKFEGVTHLDRARNEDVRWALRQDASLDVVKQKAWREKLEQVDDNRLVRGYKVVGNRPRGHPRKRSSV